MRIANPKGVDRRGRSARAQRARTHLDRLRQRSRPSTHGRRFATRGAGPSRRSRLWTIAIGAGALAAGAIFGDDAAVWFTGMSDRAVAVIAVRGASHLTPNAVASAAALESGTTIGELDVSGVATALEEHDWIASARALRLPTGTLVVEVVEREASATIAIGDVLYAVDDAGEPFAELAGSPDPALPRIVPGGAITPREANAELAEAVRLALRLPELGLAIPAEVEVAEAGDPVGYTLRLATPDTRVVLGRDDLDARLEQLARLLAVRPDVVAGAAQIDVRFADQMVLRSAPAREGSATTAVGRGRGTSRSGRPAG